MQNIRLCLFTVGLTNDNVLLHIALLNSDIEGSASLATHETVCMLEGSPLMVMAGRTATTCPCLADLNER